MVAVIVVRLKLPRYSVLLFRPQHSRTRDRSVPIRMCRPRLIILLGDAPSPRGRSHNAERCMFVHSAKNRRLFSGVVQTALSVNSRSLLRSANRPNRSKVLDKWLQPVQVCLLNEGIFSSLALRRIGKSSGQISHGSMLQKTILFA